ncbi:hypothetical protein CBER1_09827 [Cercospora berteroae]|uniref:Heterokaryon incompatibility domain-containing protein n=1 Tax=Cercospora berteroae TaxID=357750 RepID=A0A2S6BX24_9PEZI|nr:hypothetical protein CBER1_09827 [Cercospora berteroae]
MTEEVKRICLFYYHAKGLFEPVMETLADLFYERLPGDRWIRVLLLEPAERLEDELVATLRLQDLGGSLPVWPLIGSADRPHKEKDHYNRATREYWEEIRGRQLSYRALSYSWATEDGDNRRTHHIDLNSRPFKITKHLSDGMRRIRSAETTEPLWIDAICINQDDPDERSSQVSMMFDIYRSARHVLVWLGNGNNNHDDHTCTLARSLDGIVQYVHEYGRGHTPLLNRVIEGGIDVFARADLHAFCEWCNHSYPYHLDRTSRLDHAALSVLAQTIGNRFAERFKAKYQSASRLLTRALKAAAVVRRRYWTRRWIVQEFQALFDINGCVFLWGGHMAPATTIFATITAIATWNIPRFHHDVDLSSIKQELSVPTDPDGAPDDYQDLYLGSLAESYTVHSDTNSSETDSLIIVGDLSASIRKIMCAERHQSDLLYLLRKFAMYQCSDVHDRVYSLIALDPSCGLQANYSLSFDQLCLGFAKKALSLGDFRILNYACHLLPGDYSNSVLDLPSWVPDLRTIPGAGSTQASMRANPMLVASKIQSNDRLLLEAFWLGNVTKIIRSC